MFLGFHYLVLTIFLWLGFANLVTSSQQEVISATLRMRFYGKLIHVQEQLTGTNFVSWT